MSLLSAARSAIKTIFAARVYLVMARELDEELDEREPSIPVDIRVATERDAEALSVAEHGRVMPDSVSFSRERFARGHSCLAAFSGDQIVSFAWICTAGTEADGPLRFVLGHGWAQYYKAYTKPQYRGKGLQQAILARQLNRLKQRGFERVFLFVSARNHVARHNYGKTMTETGRFTELCLFSRLCMSFGAGQARHALGSPAIGHRSEVNSAT